ncbi:uncharacterized [Tachysurus ichikawai]
MCVSVAGGHRHARKGSEHSESLGSEDVWSVLGLGYCNSYKHGLVSIPTKERERELEEKKKKKEKGSAYIGSVSSKEHDSFRTAEWRGRQETNPTFQLPVSTLLWDFCLV